MPLHDWTAVDAGIFHNLHLAWIWEIKKVLNGGLLPDGYYALSEQHAGRALADLLTMYTGPDSPATGGVSLADAPPQTRWQHTVELPLSRRRSLAIRHVSG